MHLIARLKPFLGVDIRAEITFTHAQIRHLLLAHLVYARHLAGNPGQWRRAQSSPNARTG